MGPRVLLRGGSAAVSSEWASVPHLLIKQSSDVTGTLSEPAAPLADAS